MGGFHPVLPRLRDSLHHAKARRRHEKTIKHAYSKAEHGLDVLAFMGAYLPIFMKAKKLLHVTIPSTLFMAKMLQVKTEFLQASALHYEPAMKTERIINMCKAIGADIYVAGSGGSKDYLDVELLHENGIKVEWQSFSYIPYRQVGTKGFTSGLSTLDLVANLGKEQALEYIKECGKLEPATLESKQDKPMGMPPII